MVPQTGFYSTIVELNNVVWMERRKRQSRTDDRAKGGATVEISIENIIVIEKMFAMVILTDKLVYIR